MHGLSARVAQLIVLSHYRRFLCNLWERTDTDIRSAIEVVRDGDGSTIRTWDVNRDCITEYDRLHGLLRQHVNAAQPNTREVAQAIRPVLEHFCRVAYPEHFPPGRLLGPFRNMCQQRLGTAGEILNANDIQELGHLIEYANLFHHDTNDAHQNAQINDGELLGFVRRTLAFTTRR
jgi:wobble nucleotide-excising tRNase